MKASEDKDDIFCTVFTELKSLGVKVPKFKKFKSSIPKQAPLSASDFKIFGVNISEQEKISVEDYLLPRFIVTTTSYLRKFTKTEIGLFRKAGSVCRQRELRVKLERGESIEGSEPNDVASLLKQWLRELPEPLIPTYLQNLFVRCLSLQIEENKISALLLCCHLLPLDHLFTLKYFLLFLSDIASSSDKNKMGAYNLALIMAPNIFVMGTESIDKLSNSLVQQHTSVIELLISSAQKIDCSPPCSSSHVAEAEALSYSNDLDLSIDVLDYSPCRSKKKKKSGGAVQDLFTGFRKFVGQNSVSPNPKRLNQDECKPAEPRSASKRKAEPDELSMSPLKKPATSSVVSRNENMSFTPNNKGTQSIFGAREKTGSHSRRRSFGFLRKEKKRLKSKKANVPEEIRPVATPYPFTEKIESISQGTTQVSETSFQPSSPLLSPLDIELLFSKSISVKKSASDCHLTVPSKELKNRRCFSTTSTDGSLRLEGYANSPYIFRSDDKKAVKRKSDVLNNKPEACAPPVESPEEEKGSGCSPWFNQRDSKRTLRSSKTSSKKEVLSPNKADDSVSSNGNNYLSVKTINNPDCLSSPPPSVLGKRQEHEDEKNEAMSSEKDVKDPVNGQNLIRNEVENVNNFSNQDCLSTPPASIIRRSSRRRKEHEDVKNEARASLKDVKKPVDGQNRIRSDAKDVNVQIQSTSETNPKKPLNVQGLAKGEVKDVIDGVSSGLTGFHKKEGVKRNCSIVRQESFKIKPKMSRKNAMSQLKRADSIKISQSKIRHLNPPKGADLNMNGNVKSNAKNNSNFSTEGISEKKNPTPADVSNQKRISEGISEKKNSTPADVSNQKRIGEGISEIKNPTPADVSNQKRISEGISEKKNSTPADVSNQRRTKRSARNGSIVRGKPNTVRTGLPPDACSRYQNDSVSISAKHRPVASTSSVDNDLFINSVKNANGNNDHDMSLTLQLQNITLSSPKEDNKNVKNCSIQTTIVIDTTVPAPCDPKAGIDIKKPKRKSSSRDANSNTRRVTRSASKRKVRLCSNSDSKIHKIKKRPSKVSRINSFPQSRAKPKPISVMKLKAVKSSSPQKCLGKAVNLTTEDKENVFAQEPSRVNDNVFKTPEPNAQTPDVWVSGREFLESEITAQEEAFNKRESIAMIVKNNAGHVKAKANMYDYRSRSSVCTPVSNRIATPSGNFFEPQLSSTLTKQSQKRGTSVRSNKSTKRNSPLPPPPKFVIPDSPANPTYPLKELTNHSNCEDNVFGSSPAQKYPGSSANKSVNGVHCPSPAKKSISGVHSPSPAKKSCGTPNKDKLSIEEPSKKCALVLKRNSYSGHTPYKLPVKKGKVIRSESSPLLTRDANKIPKKYESQKFLSTIQDNDFSPLKTDFSSPVFKTRSSYDIENLKPQQLLP